MESDLETLWTIDELSAQVARALAVDYDGPPNGRVRDVPDRRTIRYYTTLGLLDRPREMRGRTAYYGRRHVLQLVAIKKLQSRGRSLVEIQQALVGQPDAALAAMAGEAAPTATTEAPAPSPRRDFWRRPPAPGPEEPEPVPIPVPPPARLVHGIRLAEGVTLLLEASRVPDATDVSLLVEAAAPLLGLLRQRHIISQDQDPEAGS